MAAPGPAALRGHAAMLAFSALVAGSFSLGGRAAPLIDPAVLTALRLGMASSPFDPDVHRLSGRHSHHIEPESSSVNTRLGGTPPPPACSGCCSMAAGAAAPASRPVARPTAAANRDRRE